MTDDAPFSYAVKFRHEDHRSSHFIHNLKYRGIDTAEPDAELHDNKSPLHSLFHHQIR